MALDPSGIKVLRYDPSNSRHDPIEFSINRASRRAIQGRMKTWEFKVVRVAGGSSAPAATLEKQLNELGQEGWDLFSTSVVPPPDLGVICVLRREAVAPPQAT
jgi:hypothetical protein